MAFLFDNYGKLSEDDGYIQLRKNKTIDTIYPYMNSIEPRLVQYLRSMHSHLISGVKPCVSLESQFHITYEDIPHINNYLKMIKKYNKN